MEEIEIVRVKFCEHGIYAFDPNGLDLHIGDYCVTEETDSDVNFGQVVEKLTLQRRKYQKPLRKVLRIAADSDRKAFAESARLESEARAICRKKIKDRELPMKLVSARYSSDGKKITFYFTSEKRVDFRELVKDLAYIFKRRIELRQIGVRDETKICNGFGSCGRQLCCASFLNLKKLGRLNIRMAKDQDMTLMPSKILGVCGRLLCCLQYENEWYQEVKEVMPEIGNTIKTENVTGKVEELDIFYGIARVKDDKGRLVEVNIRDFKEEPKGKKKSGRRRKG